MIVLMMLFIIIIIIYLFIYFFALSCELRYMKVFSMDIR